ncbi:MAG: tetratricopeptide repeat protein [Planctomycetota bacterium]
MRARGGAIPVVVCALLAAAPASSASAQELAPVLFPDLSAFEVQVVEQLQAGRSTLEAAIADDALSRRQLSEAYGTAAKLYHAYTLRDAAGACYRNAQALAREDYRWPYYLGHLYRAQGKPEESIAAFERALELRPGLLSAITHLAQVHFDQNRFDEAEALYRQALQIDRLCVPALIGLAHIALGRRRFEVAVRAFETALRLSPAASEIHYPLGLAYRGLGKRDKALAHMNRRGTAKARVSDPLIEELRGLPTGWRIHQNRGTTLFEQERYQDALKEFRAAVEAAPDVALPHVNLGSTLTVLGQHEGAKKHFQEALRIDPRHALVNYNLGTLLARQGDDEGAIGHYRRALDRNPLLKDAHFNLANALRRTGDFEAAAGHYRRVVEIDPRNGIARIAEALALLRLHRYPQARARLEEAHQVLPEDLRIRNALARVLATSRDPQPGDGARALTLADHLFRKESSLTHVETFAMAWAAAGRYQDAVRWQEAALEAARRKSHPQRVPFIEENLALYRRGRPCRIPWRDDDPVLSPPPGVPEGGKKQEKGG